MRKAGRESERENEKSRKREMRKAEEKLKERMRKAGRESEKGLSKLDFCFLQKVTLLPVDPARDFMKKTVPPKDQKPRLT